MVISSNAWVVGSIAVCSLWALSLILLYPRLHKHHPSVFADLGSPHFRKRNELRHAWLLLRWLYSFAFLSIPDRAVVAIGSLMVVTLPTMLLWIFGPALGLLDVRFAA
jgi:hypothetical protein